jgi:hypothetical protein
VASSFDSTAHPRYRMLWAKQPQIDELHRISEALPMGNSLRIV